MLEALHMWAAAGQAASMTAGPSGQHHSTEPLNKVKILYIGINNLNAVQQFQDNNMNNFSQGSFWV